MFRSDPPPAVRSLRLKVSEGVPVGDALDALQAASIALQKGKQHGEGEPLSPNPASRRLIRHIEESYEIMADSLAKEIAKVFDE